MVLQAELYSRGGFQQQGYMQAEDYYSKNGYANKEENYTKHGYGRKEDYSAADGYYNSGSSMQMRPDPFVTTPQPPKHHAIGHDGYAQSYKHHIDGWYGQPPSYNDHGHNDYDKYSNGMHHSALNAGYESHTGSYKHMGPDRYEYMRYNYYAEGPDRYPPYNEQHKDQRNWPTNGAEWILKGIDD